MFQSRQQAFITFDKMPYSGLKTLTKSMIPVRSIFDVDPFFDTLLDNPSFQELLTKRITKK